MLCFKCTAKWFSYISVEFSLSVVPDSLQPHGLQNAMLPSPSPTPDLAQAYVNWVSDAIQPSHPLSSPSPPTFSLSQHEVLFQWVSSLHQVAKVLELKLQHQSFQWILRTHFLYNWLVWSPHCPRDWRVFSRTTVQKYQFFGAQPSLWSSCHIHTWLLEKP